MIVSGDVCFCLSHLVFSSFLFFFLLRLYRSVILTALFLFILLPNLISIYWPLCCLTLSVLLIVPASDFLSLTRLTESHRATGCL